jgi:choline/glycine/proline betaine transport protein
MLAMCAGLLKALRAERDSPRPTALAEDLAPAGEALNLPPHVDDDWRARLRYVAARGRGEAGRGMRHPARLALAAFIRETVLPALEEVAAEMRRNGREILIDRHPLHAGVTVMHDGREEFFYVVKGRVSQRYAATIADLAPDDTAPAEAEIVVRGGHSRSLPLETLDRGWLLEDFSGQYGRWMGW